MAKYLLIAAIVISVATAVIGYVNHGTLVDTKKNLDETTTTLGARTKELDGTKKKLSDTETTLAATEKAKTDLAAELTTTKGDLDKANTDLKTATDAGAEKDAKIADQEAQMEKLRQAAGGGGGDGQDLGKIVDQLKQQIAEQSASIASLQEKANQDKATIAQFVADKKARDEKVMRKGLEGRVLAVNPAWNFVVVGIGDKQGVVSNAEMLLKRGDQYLGKVRITSVEPSTSIADIIVNTLPSGVSVQPGDSVIYQGND
jgi:DNA repair exonuclease SbcCD ATPase subunit